MKYECAPTVHIRIILFVRVLPFQHTVYHLDTHDQYKASLHRLFFRLRPRLAECDRAPFESTKIQLASESAERKMVFETIVTRAEGREKNVVLFIILILSTLLQNKLFETS